jgi:N-methylhydantoinase A
MCYADPTGQRSHAASDRLARMDSGARLGVDVGGTFTDLVALVDGRLITGKVPSTPRDQSEGVMHALEAAGIEEAAAFAHGMTVATNALLERRGARTALVTTAGFRDVIEIGRQDRAALYALGERRPEPLVPRELRFCVRERTGPEGELEPLDAASVDEVVAALRDADVDAVAVCLLFAFLHPAHERAVGDAIREALPDVHVSLSSGVLPEFREYERFSTTVADAYLGPRLRSYLERLGWPGVGRGGAGAAGDAVLGRRDRARGGGRERSGVRAVGPGGRRRGRGARGAGGRLRGRAHVRHGRHEHGRRAGRGRRAADLDRVGGRRRADQAADDRRPHGQRGRRLDRLGGRGRRAAGRAALGGADPGPAAYGKGGEEPTVTDANLLCGLLADGTELGGEVTLDRGRAEGALAALGERLGLDALETALGVIRVANAEMSRALRVISVSAGWIRATSRWWRSAAPVGCTPARWPRSSACAVS